MPEADADMIQEARDLEAIHANFHGGSACRTCLILHALVDEVERWRSGANAIESLTTQEIDAIRECDKCDLCEDHHG